MTKRSEAARYLEQAIKISGRTQKEMSYCRVWCLRVHGHAAIWSGFWVSMPSLNVTPVMTLAR